MGRSLFFASGAAAMLASTLRALGALAPVNIMIDPRAAIGRKTSRSWRSRSRYSGEDLRTIRATGQHHECARRRRQLGTVD